MDFEPVGGGTRTEYVRQEEPPAKTSPSEIDENEIAEAPVYYHESGDMFAEDVEQHMAVLPEVAVSTEEITIEDIQIDDSKTSLTSDQLKLRALI